MSYQPVPPPQEDYRQAGELYCQRRGAPEEVRWAPHSTSAHGLIQSSAAVPRDGRHGARGGRVPIWLPFAAAVGWITVADDMWQKKK
ncbi:hypothetical protein L484_013170 [Morus notabilis]|uniref:Uncharacterized protein n=1 Tax=Morus notabilis TaxID=981085 RepID=W9RBX3_9ROSA|nr:hypothetical protein L484_013170 [Morus notabilis]